MSARHFGARALRRHPRTFRNLRPNSHSFRFLRASQRCFCAPQGSKGAWQEAISTVSLSIAPKFASRNFIEMEEGMSKSILLLSALLVCVPAHAAPK